MQLIERYRGSLLGLAIGDALGAPMEFHVPGIIGPITDFMDNDVFHIPAGYWTDDTSNALCLADSLIKSDGFDPIDQLKRYVRWYKEGYLSCNGRCFDIGNTMRGSLIKFLETGEPFCGPTDYHSAGNGSLMRLAPVPLFYANNPYDAIKYAGLSSRTTHGAQEAVDACRYYASLILGALRGASKDDLLSSRYQIVPGIWEKEPLSPKIDEIAAGSFKAKSPPEIKSSGYVVKSMEAALWAFYNSSTFEEGALLAVNLGGDADTTGAIYGQLAGAYYGEKGIPQRWRNKVARRDIIICFAEKLYDKASVKK